MLKGAFITDLCIYKCGRLSTEEGVYLSILFFRKQCGSWILSSSKFPSYCTVLNGGGGYPPPPFLEYGTIFKFSWWNELRTAKNCKQKQSFFYFDWLNLIWKPDCTKKLFLWLIRWYYKFPEFELDSLYYIYKP